MIRYKSTYFYQWTTTDWMTSLTGTSEEIFSSKRERNK